jgi:glycosyltransferase involved in cell wall biosynthesis
MKILIICEHFAPQAGAQALQATKVVDALHDAGCEVRVLCGEPQVSTTPHRYVVDWVAPKLHGKPKGVAGRVLRQLRYEYGTVCTRGAWVSEMLHKAIEISEVFAPDIVLTLSTPFRVHLVGLRLPQHLRERWVAFFSDLWPLSLVPHPYRTRIADVLRPVQLGKLIQVLSKARCSIFTNEVSIQRIMRAWPNGHRDKLHVVSHIGTPEPDQALDPELVAHYAKRFVHVGKLTRERACPQLVDAITELQSASEHGGAPFPGFTFVGDVDPDFRRKCIPLERAGLIEFTGDVEAAAAQAISRAAGTLVVIEAPMDESPFLASKFADYAVLRKPILAITQQGPIRTFLKHYGGGIAVGHQTAEIRTAMESFIALDPVQVGSAALAAQFDASHVARQYLDIFERVL